MADSDDSRRSPPTELPKIRVDSLLAEQAAADAQQATSEGQTNSEGIPLVRWSSDTDAPPETAAEKRRIKNLRDDVISHARDMANVAQQPSTMDGADPEGKQLEDPDQQEELRRNGPIVEKDGDPGASEGQNSTPETQRSERHPGNYILVSTKDPPPDDNSPETNTVQATAPGEQGPTPDLPPVPALDEERRSTEVYIKLFAAASQAPNGGSLGHEPAVQLPPVRGYFDDPDLRIGENPPELAQDMPVINHRTDHHQALVTSTSSEYAVTPLPAVSPSGLGSPPEKEEGGDKGSAESNHDQDSDAVLPTSTWRKPGGLGIIQIDAIPDEGPGSRGKRRKRTSSPGALCSNKRIRREISSGTDLLATPDAPLTEIVEVGNESCQLSLVHRRSRSPSSSSSSEPSSSSSSRHSVSEVRLSGTRSPMVPASHFIEMLDALPSWDAPSSDAHPAPELNFEDPPCSVLEEGRTQFNGPQLSSAYKTGREEVDGMQPRTGRKSKLLSQASNLVTMTTREKLFQEACPKSPIHRDTSETYSSKEQRKSAVDADKIGQEGTEPTHGDRVIHGCDQVVEQSDEKYIIEMHRAGEGLGKKPLVLTNGGILSPSAERSSLVDCWKRNEACAHEYLRPIIQAEDPGALDSGADKLGAKFREGSGEDERDPPPRNSQPHKTISNEESSSTPRYANERVASIIQSLHLDSSNSSEEHQDEAATVVLGPGNNGVNQTQRSDSEEGDNQGRSSWQQSRIVWGERDDDSADSEAPPDPPEEVGSRPETPHLESPKITKAPIAGSDDEDDQEDETGRRRTVVWAGSLTLIPIPSRADIAAMYPSSEESLSPPAPPPPKPIFSKWEENRFFSDDSEPEIRHAEVSPQEVSPNDDEQESEHNLPDDSGLPLGVPRIGDSYYEKALSGFKWSTQVAPASADDTEGDSPPVLPDFPEEEIPEVGAVNERNSIDASTGSERVSSSPEQQNEKHTQTENPPTNTSPEEQSSVDPPPNVVKNEVKVENVGISGAVRCRVQIGGVKKFQAPTAPISNPSWSQPWQPQEYPYPQHLASQQGAPPPNPQLNMDVWLPVRKISVDLQGNCQGQPWSTAQVLVQPCYWPSMPQIFPGASHQPAPASVPSFHQANVDPCDFTVDISHDFNLSQHGGGASSYQYSSVPSMADPTGCQQQMNQQPSEAQEVLQMSRLSASDMIMPHSCSNASPIPWINSPIIHCLPSRSAGSVSDRTYAGSADAEACAGASGGAGRQGSKSEKTTSSSLLPSFRDKCGCDGGQQILSAMPAFMENSSVKQAKTCTNTRRRNSRSRVCPIRRKALQRATSLKDSKLSQHVEKESMDLLSVFKMFKFHNHNYPSVEAIFNNPLPGQLTPCPSDVAVEHQMTCPGSKDNTCNPVDPRDEDAQQLTSTGISTELNAQQDVPNDADAVNAGSTNVNASPVANTMELTDCLPTESSHGSSPIRERLESSSPNVQITRGLVNAPSSPFSSQIMPVNRKVCDLIRKFESRQDSDGDLRKRDRSSELPSRNISPQALSNTNVNRALDHGDSQPVVETAIARGEEARTKEHEEACGGEEGLPLPNKPEATDVVPQCSLSPQPEASPVPMMVMPMTVAAVSQEFKVTTEPFPEASSSQAPTTPGLPFSQTVEHLALNLEDPYPDASVSLQKSSTVHLFRRGSTACEICRSGNLEAQQLECMHEAFGASSHMAPYQSHLQLMTGQNLQAVQGEANLIRKFLASSSNEPHEHEEEEECAPMPKKVAGSCPNVMQAPAIPPEGEKKHPKAAYSLLLDNQRKMLDVHGLNTHPGRIGTAANLDSFIVSRAFETVVSEGAKASAMEVHEEQKLNIPPALPYGNARFSDESTLISDHLGDSSTPHESVFQFGSQSKGDESDNRYSAIIMKNEDEPEAEIHDCDYASKESNCNPVEDDEDGSMKVNFSAGVSRTELTTEEDLNYAPQDSTSSSFETESAVQSDPSSAEDDLVPRVEIDGSFVDQVIVDIMADKHLSQKGTNDDKAEVRRQSSLSSFESSVDEPQVLELQVKQDEPSTAKTDTGTVGTMAGIPALADWEKESFDYLQSSLPIDKTQQDMDTSISEHTGNTEEHQTSSTMSEDNEVAINRTLEVAFCSTFETGVGSPSAVPAGLNKEIRLAEFVVEKKVASKKWLRSPVKHSALVPKLQIPHLRHRGSAVLRPDVTSKRLKEQKSILGSITKNKAAPPIVTPAQVKSANHVHFKELDESFVYSPAQSASKWLPNTFKRTAKASVETLKQCPVHSSNPVLDMLSSVLDGRMSFQEAGKVLVKRAVKRIETQLDKDFDKLPAAAMISSIIGRLTPINRNISSVAQQANQRCTGDELQREESKVDSEIASSDDCLKECHHEKVKVEGLEGSFWACIHDGKSAEGLQNSTVVSKETILEGTPGDSLHWITQRIPFGTAVEQRTRTSVSLPQKSIFGTPLANPKHEETTKKLAVAKLSPAVAEPPAAHRVVTKTLCIENRRPNFLHINWQAKLDMVWSGLPQQNILERASTVCKTFMSFPLPTGGRGILSKSSYHALRHGQPSIEDQANVPTNPLMKDAVPKTQTSEPKTTRACPGPINKTFALMDSNTCSRLRMSSAYKEMVCNLVGETPYLSTDRKLNYY